MRYHLKIALVLLVTLLISGVVLAKFVGRFYCNTCSVSDLKNPVAAGEVDMFMRAVINQEVDSWQDAQGNPNTVLICNGTICANYRYIKMTGLLLYLGYFNSTWRGESGGGSPPVGGGPLEPPPMDGDIFPGCQTRTVKVCVSTAGGPDKCEYQTFLEC